MRESNMDSRVRRTKRLLREGLTELLAEKSVKKITVRELSERVDINRGTFYLHYKDIFDLVDQIEKELFSEFEEIVSSYTLEDLKNNPHAVFLDMCKFLSDNQKICAALLGDNGDINFVINMRTFLREKCLNDLLRFPTRFDSKEYEYIYAYFEAGALGLIRYWLEHPQDQKSPEEISVLIEKIFTNGATYISTLIQNGENHA